MILEDRKWLAVLDAGFVALAWAVLMRAILGPGRALHPDSPVLNSDELRIKLLFLGMVVALSVAAFAATWLLTTLRRPSEPESGDVAVAVR
jgi:hypothetical protein